MNARRETQTPDPLRDPIRRAMYRANMTQTRLGELTGMGQSHVSDFLRGDEITTGNLRKICLALGLELRKVRPPSA